MYALCMKQKSEKQGRRMLLYSYLILLVISALLILFSFGRIKESIRKSEALSLIQSYRNVTSTQPQSRVVTVVFPLYLPEEGNFMFYPYTLPLSQESRYHGQIEALLDGPPVKALSDGAITFIPHSTSLIGLTLSQQILFINLSDDFLKESTLDPDFTLRVEQVRQTVLSDSTIKDVVLYIEGKEFTKVVK